MALTDWYEWSCRPDVFGLFYLKGTFKLDLFVYFTNEQEGDVRIPHNERTFIPVQSRHGRVILSGMNHFMKERYIGRSSLSVIYFDLFEMSDSGTISSEFF